METIAWIITGASLVGTVLNIKKNKACFMIWTATNAFWAGYDYWIGAYAQAALFATYFCLAIWGLWEWHRETPAAPEPVVSMQDFVWACGHVGPAICKTCHEQQLDTLARDAAKYIPAAGDNEITRLQTSRAAVIAGLAKKHCPPPPNDECPAQPVTPTVCEGCWMNYFDIAAGDPADIKED